MSIWRISRWAWMPPIMDWEHASHTILGGYMGQVRLLRGGEGLCEGCQTGGCNFHAGSPSGVKWLHAGVLWLLFTLLGRGWPSASAWAAICENGKLPQRADASVPAIIQPSAAYHLFNSRCLFALSRILCVKLFELKVLFQYFLCEQTIISCVCLCLCNFTEWWLWNI